MKTRKGFTLLEIVIVIMVIVILSGVAIPNYMKAREGVAKKEAFVNLRLLQALERSQRMDTNAYYPASSYKDTADINNDLKINLPVGASRNWDYRAYDTGCVRATGVPDNSKVYHIHINDADPGSGGCS